MTINGDGIDNPYGKVFNQTYPGRVILSESTSRTSFAITVLQSTGMASDKMAPLLQMTLSHMSFALYNGLAGPITIFGPSSENCDEARDPILITDWGHRSAFQEWERELTGNPIRPQMNSILINVIIDHILVGIGQRYHVVRHADPKNETKFPASENGNYWIRTVPAEGCKGSEDGNELDERQGFLRYEPEEKNKPQLGNNFSWWAFGEQPLWLNFSEPTIMLLDEKKEWPGDYVIIPAENRDRWVYLVITAPKTNELGNNRTFISLAHPLHLHGHDFALLAQGNDSSQIDDPDNSVVLKFDNPPRRDVALIPAGGYLIVAFKADNPGSWLFHCHIAWHASSGLALQIMEREEDLRKTMTLEKLQQVNDGCKKWNEWFADTENLWSQNATLFQDDSGV
ncbi:laccase 2 [Fusarium beomiforme]|uniref:Laccase 2 n=1 Tax=Fusarium beomiforme TaxID=44412 RepID=A0A9P5ABV0_9HYPO|nr:laccase 2 [Fusarium beomiforme]